MVAALDEIFNFAGLGVGRGRRQTNRGTGRPGRDQQRQRAYDAEHAIDDFGETFADLDGAKRYVARMLASKWLRRHFPGVRSTIEVRDGRGRRRAAAFGTYAITLPRWARNTTTVLHEIAHCLTPRDPGHGAEWARCYLMLVQHFLGRAAAAALRASFKAHGVRYARAAHPAARSAARRRGAALLASQSPEQRARNLAKARVALAEKRLAKIDERIAQFPDWAREQNAEMRAQAAGKVDAARAALADAERALATAPAPDAECICAGDGVCTVCRPDSPAPRHPPGSPLVMRLTPKPPADDAEREARRREEVAAVHARLVTLTFQCREIAKESEALAIKLAKLLD